MRAIVYAAGISARMNENIPDGLKGLTMVGGQFLIQYQLNWLSDYNPREILIVIGLEHQRYIDELGMEYKGIPIKYIYNPDYKTKGNMLSLWHAREFCNEDIIFTTSDLLCDRRDIDLFMEDSSVDKILVDKYNEELFVIDDPVKVKIKDNRIIKIRKRLDEIDRVDGISIGIYKFSKRLMKELINCINNKINSGNDNLSLYYPIDDAINFSKVKPVFTRESKWLDIDTPEELLLANNLIDKHEIET